MGSSREEVKLSSEESRVLWDRLIQEWRQSGLEQMTFCKEKGLKYYAFKYQIYKRRDSQKTNQSQPLDFMQINLKQNQNKTMAERLGAVKIELPSGVVIKISNAVDATVLNQVLRFLGEQHVKGE